MLCLIMYMGKNSKLESISSAEFWWHFLCLSLLFLLFRCLMAFLFLNLCCVLSFFFYLNFYDLFVSGMLNFMMKCLVFWGASWAFSNYRFIFFNSEKISSAISFIASPPLFFVDILFFWNSYFRWQTPQKYTLIFLSFLYFLSVFKKWRGGGGVWLNFPTLLLNF